MFEDFGIELPEGLSNTHSRFLEELFSLDDVVQIVLKGHLLLEEHMEDILKTFVIHEQYVEEARLTFANKMNLCRALTLDQNESEVWSVIKHINKVRNQLSHSLAPAKRLSAIQALHSAYKSTGSPFQVEALEKAMSSEAAICTLSIGLSYGFLNGFLQETQDISKAQEIMDLALNKLKEK